MGYVTAADVLLTAGITSTEVPTATVNLMIEMAEDEVDRLTNTTYWKVEESGTAHAGAGNSELTDTGAFAGDTYTGDYAWIYGGTGIGQMREILSHTDDTLTLDRAWTTNPDATSTYRIIHTGSPAYVGAELRDGDDTDELFLKSFPLQILESLTIDGTTVTPSYVYQYKQQGRLKLGASAQEQSFPSKEAQLTDIDYWYGVYPFPGMVKSYVLTIAALRVLQVQMGGTHNIPSTYSLPEGSVTVGQAYVNIRGTWDVLMKNKEALEPRLVKYVSFS